MSTGLQAKNALFIGYPSPGELLAAGIVLPLIALATISLRYMVRRSRKARFGVDDWLLIPALLALTGIGACIIIGVVKKAVGYPAPPPASSSPEAALNDLSPVEALSEKLDFAITILTIVAYCFIKLSIAFLYRRIFVVSGHSKIFSIVTWTLIAIIISWSITFFLLFIFDCGIHTSAQWGSEAELARYCPDGIKHEEALYISEFFTNVVLALAPIPSILRLQLTTAAKFQIIGIFLLAFSAFAASIVRLILAFEITQSVTFGQDFDINQTNSTIFYWNMVEAGIALIACCLPTLKPLMSGQGIGSAIASIRSVISLPFNNSLTSQNSNTVSHNSKTSRTYRKMERDGSVMVEPLKEGNIELKSISSREPSGEHIV
ncbi:d50c81d9-2706-463f-b1d0-bde9585233ce [Sclerotinia trifoliorum]|uniref:D50c81d9-2706-463f-b1d0-bde9585233ce n=1 Tax=Sclerotinia trifoliorum TaxID=28548 RepID=A0A8H2VW16_9HELO|nr:d50c81d9-2706-463f-b1d0-bde9585233ce [Sclerotinia trifoliorum]